MKTNGYIFPVFQGFATVFYVKSDNKNVFIFYGPSRRRSIQAEHTFRKKDM